MADSMIESMTNYVTEKRKRAERIEKMNSMERYVERINREESVEPHGFKFGGIYIPCRIVKWIYPPTERGVSLGLSDGRIVHEICKDIYAAEKRLDLIIEWCGK